VTGTLIPAHHLAAFERYRRLARLFDSRFRIPGTRIRFGIDPLLGLLPVAGDLVTAAFAVYGVVLARRMNAPGRLQLRMGWNIAIDALAGSVPVLGDLFDAAFKAHSRNVLLLERWLEDRSRQ
jgi:hypothetical protein